MHQAGGDWSRYAAELARARPHQLDQYLPDDSTPPEEFSMLGKPLPTSSASSAGLRDLMARMGHDSERAAMIYQHEARGADKTITSAIGAHIEAEQTEGKDDDDDGSAGALVPVG